MGGRGFWIEEIVESLCCHDDVTKFAASDKSALGDCPAQRGYGNAIKRSGVLEFIGTA